MLYIGHFDFVEDDEHGPSHGYFTCVVEAGGIEEALEKFRTLLPILKKNEDVLDGINEVYLDSCIEVGAVPEAGFLAHYARYSGKRTTSISTSVRGVTEDQCVAYGLEPDEEDEHDVPAFFDFSGQE